MPKNLSPEEIVAALTSLGVEIPAELNKAVENAKEDSAFRYLLDKVPGHDSEDTKERAAARKTAESWQKRLFDLSSEVSEAFPGTLKNRGQGQRRVSTLIVETHEGTLKVELSREV